jgi:hypothetical protein
MVGQCFYYQTPPTGDHLFIVVAPSAEQNDWFLCVNITTKTSGSETTCELSRGEHPSLTAETSVVAYAWAREFPKTLIERHVAQQRLDAFKGSVLLKIQQAALLGTSRLPRKFQSAITKYLRGPV